MSGAGTVVSSALERTLNKSPSEKEGKSGAAGAASAAGTALNESPSEKEGKFGGDSWAEFQDRSPQ